MFFHVPYITSFCLFLMYHYSPMTVNNLGIVGHAHKYPDGTVGEQMHCHMDTNAIGKKGANNVAFLIMKTLRHLNFFWKDSIGSELNIVFDNCYRQNKNNTVLRLAAWLAQLGHFLKVNFIFLVDGHTKDVGLPIQFVEDTALEEEYLHF
jgi:hypothetical protein